MKQLRKIFAMALAIIMMMSLSATAFAAETLSDNTIWRGNEIVVNAESRDDGYGFYLVEVGNLTSYEMSNHMVTTGLLRGDLNPRDTKPYYASEIPQLFMMVDATKGLENWSPDAPYSFGVSDYEVLYCCDAETGTDGTIRYKRMNLEDSEYYSDEAAAHIRAIVTNSYPYVSLEQMKADLAEAGFVGAELLTRSEVISAVQTAIWGYANSDEDKNSENPPVKYSHTFHVPLNTGWGEPMHDFTNEMEIWWEAQAASMKTPNNLTEADYITRYEGDKPVANVSNDGVAYNDGTQQRINSLITYLMNLEAVEPEDKQVVISQLEIKDAVPVIGKGGTYQVALQLALNNSGSSENDEIAINVYVNDELALTKAVELGIKTYDLLVEAPAGATIKAVVSGSQILPEGVYFYAPASREDSQSMVGVAKGETAVYDDVTVTLDPEEEVDPVTGTLYLQKVGENGQALSGAEFALYVNTAEATIQVGTYAVDENGQLTIENLMPGNYELREVTAPAGYALSAETIAFTVSAEDGSIISETADINEDGMITVVNYLLPEPPAPPVPEGVTISASKVWVGDTAENRPASVTVQLLRNGSVYDEVSLTANNGWACRWYDLDVNAEWTVVEASVPAGYTSSVAQNGTSFVITNTYGNVELPEPPVPLQPSAPTMGDFVILDEEDVPLADVPATGDPLTVMAAVSALSAAGVYFTRKKRDEE